jgi:hypothetical protein
MIAAASMIRLSKIRCHSLVIFIVSSLSNVQQNNFSKFYRAEHVLRAAKSKGRQETRFVISTEGTNLS